MRLNDENDIGVCWCRYPRFQWADCLNNKWDTDPQYKGLLGLLISWSTEERFLVNFFPSELRKSAAHQTHLSNKSFTGPYHIFFMKGFFITNTIQKSKLATIKILTTILSRVNTLHVYQWNKAEAIVEALVSSFSKPWIPSSLIVWHTNPHK